MGKSTTRISTSMAGATSRYPMRRRRSSSVGPVGMSVMRSVSSDEVQPGKCANCGGGMRGREDVDVLPARDDRLLFAALGDDGGDSFGGDLQRLRGGLLTLKRFLNL